jgi:hypothetical protein
MRVIYHKLHNHLEQNIYLTASAIKEYILTKWNIVFTSSY